MAASLSAQTRLDIAGVVNGVTDDAIGIRVGLTNRGPEVARKLSVRGSLFGEASEARLEGELGVGGTRELLLSFPTAHGAPGLHAVELMLDYSTGPREAALPFTQPAWVMIAIGEQVQPSVKLRLGPGRVDTAGRLEVGLESADGAAHRVRLSVTTPPGLRGRPSVESVDVPARGEVTTPVWLFRVDAPWNSQQGLLVVARDENGPLVRTSVAAGSAQIGSDPARLPRWRRALVGVAFLLLAAALAVELRRRRGLPTAA
jgi:hypothetical protein